MRYIPGNKLTRRMVDEVVKITGISEEHHSRYAFLMTRGNRVPHFFKHPLPLFVLLADLGSANRKAKEWSSEQHAKRFNAKLKADGLGVTGSSKRRQPLSAEERDAKKFRELRRKPSYMKVESQRPFVPEVRLIKKIDIPSQDK